ncbi:MAG: hypothetical protein IJX18_03510 [Clostridia bacterium]|nr:hypothetical protein [Clostridia bacterium]
MNAGTFATDNIADGLTDAYVLGTLYEYGGVAYDPATGAWLRYTGAGRQTVYGRNEAVTMFGANGANVTRKRGEVFIFNANPDGVPLKKIIDAKAETLAEFDAAIRQNLDAIKDMTVIYADNPDMVAQLRNADNKRRAGASVAVLSRSVEDFGEVGKLSTGCEYKIDRLLKDRRKLYEEALHLVGVRTPIEKGERMITNEVETQNAETDAYIGIMERTFNASAALYGLPFRLKMNVVPVDVVGEEV